MVIFNLLIEYIQDIIKRREYWEIILNLLAKPGPDSISQKWVSGYYTFFLLWIMLEQNTVEVSQSLYQINEYGITLKYETFLDHFLSPLGNQKEMNLQSMTQFFKI